MVWKEKKIKLFIVDDSYAIIKVLEKIFASEPEIELLGYARDGKSAITSIQNLKPDVLILDIEMPHMNGIEVIKHLVRNYPIPILVFSSLTYNGAEITNQALLEGALDFICKPKSLNEFEDIKAILIERVKLISRVKVMRKIDIKPIRPLKVKKIDPFAETKKIIVIGCSTGGPRALYTLFSKLPKPLNLPIAVAQHMPEKFTRVLAEHLSKITHYNVKEVEDNEEIKNSTIYIGQGGRNFIIKNGFRFAITTDGKKALPSVDMLFKSAAEVFKNRVVAIVLTGMGNDGLEGAREIKKNGGIVIAESESSAVIYGMSKVIINNNLADKIVNLNDIPDVLKNLV